MSVISWKDRAAGRYRHDCGFYESTVVDYLSSLREFKGVSIKDIKEEINSNPVWYEDVDENRYFSDPYSYAGDVLRRLKERGIVTRCVLCGKPASTNIENLFMYDRISDIPKCNPLCKEHDESFLKYVFNKDDDISVSTMQWLLKQVNNQINKARR